MSQPSRGVIVVLAFVDVVARNLQACLREEGAVRVGPQRHRRPSSRYVPPCASLCRGCEEQLTVRAQDRPQPANQTPLRISGEQEDQSYCDDARERPAEERRRLHGFTGYGGFRETQAEGLHEARRGVDAEDLEIRRG